MKNTKGLVTRVCAGILAFAAVLVTIIGSSLMTTGCATSKQVSTNVVVNPVTGVSVTNVTTNVVVNTAVVDLEATGLQLAFTTITPYIVGADPSLKVPLQDVVTALQGVLTGATTNSVSQILTLAGQNNPALATQLTPIIAKVSAWEQAELQKYGATAYGEVVIPEATAVANGLAAGLALPPVVLSNSK